MHRITTNIFQPHRIARLIRTEALLCLCRDSNFYDNKKAFLGETGQFSFGTAIKLAYGLPLSKT